MKYLLFAGMLLLASSSLRAQLDNTFGGDGKVWVEGPGNSAFFFDMLLQPADQKILVLGTYPDRIFLARFLPTGALDAGGFGTGGTTTLAPSVLIPAMKMGLQSSGKIVIGSELEPTTNSRYPTLMRLNGDGSPDMSFTSPYLILTQVASFNTLTIQPDDKILVGGTGGSGIVVARYSKDGVIDPSFGSGGVATTTGTEVVAMAVDVNGNIDVLSATAGSGLGMAVTRFTQTGAIDHNFGTNGTAVITVLTYPLQGSGLFIQADGNILLAGSYTPTILGAAKRFLIARLDNNGHYDATFGSNGKLGVEFPGYQARATGVLQDYQGSIYATGTVASSANGHYSFGLCRVTPNGVLDTRFGSGGQYITSFSGKDAYCGRIIIEQKDHKIITGGGLEWRDLSQDAMAVARYNNPIILPTLPRVATADGAAVPGSGAVIGAGAAFGGGAAEVRVFPNPVGSMFRVQGLDAGGPTMLVVRDAAGRAMMSVKVERQSEYSLGVGRLAAGTYFLEVVSGDKRKSLSFVKASN